MTGFEWCSTDQRPREHCGVFGAFGVPNVSQTIYNGLFSLQHRGQEGAGIVVSDGEKIRSVKGMGLVGELAGQIQRGDVPGRIGIGHVRYSTTGASRLTNVQPLVVECVDGIWAIAHNGNLINAHQLRRQYQEAGAIFQTSTDSEILLHLIADPLFRSRPRRLERALSELKGAFSFLLLTRDAVMAARDPFGFRPLSIGSLGTGFVFASETCALEQVGATYIRDVLPGELVTIDAKGIRCTTFCEPITRSLGQCIFEHVYFARPDSTVFGQSVHEARLRLGRLLAEEHPVDADVVIPVPDSGNSAALGYAERSGLPLDYGFIRNHYIGRTFIMPEISQRQDSVDLKLAVVPGVVREKRVVVVDDSLIRGNTSKRRINALRQAGAKEIHLRISCPPTRNPCYFGIDFPTRAELIASDQSLEEVRAFVGADSIGYLSLEGLLSAVEQPSDYCTGCYSGIYPLEVAEGQSKHALENPQASYV